jgi:GNAT superfamily N-acetyltransferase
MTVALPARRLRTATSADAPLLFRFICALAEYEREPDAVQTTPEVLAQQLEAPQPPFECLLCEEEGVAVGFALFFPNYSTWLGQPGIHIEDLFVVPEARGRGHGRALLQRVAELAVERGCGRVEWSVLDWNAPAIGFYEKLGAVPQSEWTTFRLTGRWLRALGAKRSLE